MPRMNGENGLPKGFTDKWVRTDTQEVCREQRGTPTVSFFEPIRRGLSLELVCSYGETKTWRALVYANGKPRSYKLGIYSQMPLKAARDAARAYHENPDEFRKRKLEVASDTFMAVAENWLDTRENSPLAIDAEARRE